MSVPFSFDAITLAWIRAVARLNLQFIELTSKEKGTDIEMQG
jgi:hypothetical protein